MNKTENMETKKKVGVSAWISLILMLSCVSGIFTNMDNPLRILDFGNLTGTFGIISGAEGNFIGTGGTASREGFMQALNLIPGIMMVNGLMGVLTKYGVFDAATILFKPLLGPLLGLPGCAGIAFSSSFNNTDIGAYMTNDLYNNGDITDDQRTVFVAYQYAGSAVIGNTVNTGAAMLPVTVIASGPIILIEIFCKFAGANLVRAILYFSAKRKGEK